MLPCMPKYADSRTVYFSWLMCGENQDGTVARLLNTEFPLGRCSVYLIGKGSREHLLRLRNFLSSLLWAAMTLVMLLCTTRRGS